MLATIHTSRGCAADGGLSLTLCALLLLSFLPCGCHHAGSGFDGEPASTPACDVPPGSLSFLDPAPVYVPFEEIVANTILGAGECPIIGEVIDPPLPAGLSFTIEEGNLAAIVGIPVNPGTTTTHTVTILFESGGVSVDITITILPLLPVFSYPTADITVASGTPITSIVPEMAASAGSADSWSVSPPLPPGLDLDTTSGVITGTPLETQGPGEVVVTATNSAGSHGETLTFSVLAEPVPVGRAVVRESSSSVELAKIYIGYNQNIVAATGGTPPEIEVTGFDDSLGDSFSVTIEADRYLDVELGAGATVKSRQTYDANLGDGPGSPSGLRVISGVFSELTGLEITIDTAVDIVPGFVPRLGITTSTPGPTTAAHLFHLERGAYPQAVTISDGSVHISRIVSTESGLEVEGWTVISGEEVEALVAGDFDGDGDGDLITTGDDHTVVWFQNNGNFTPEDLDPDGGDSIVIGDIDGDGDLDVVAADDDDDLLLLIGDGTGEFEDGEIEIEVGGALLLEDLDGDGDLDLFVGNEGSGEPHFLMGVNGQLIPLAAHPIPGPGVSGAVVGDFDRDGIIDIALSRENGDVEVWLGEGGFAFSSSGATIATSATSIETADLDSDGALDLVILADGSIIGCFNAGSGNFSLPTPLTDWQISLTGGFGLGDFDLDGDIDAIAGYAGDATQTLLLASALASSWGNATFTNGTPLSDVGESHATASGDIDGDGRIDIAVASIAEDGGPGTSRILFGRSDGTFDTVDLGAPPDTRAVALLDVDNDGDLDIALGCYEEATRLLINLGDRLFVEGSGLPFLASDRTTSLAAEDLDRDGNVDLIEGVLGFNHIWRGDGDGGFTAHTQPFPYVHTYSIAIVDVEQDGDFDLVFGNSTGRHNRIWLNDGNGAFTDSGQILGLMEVRSIASGDLDKDGDSDLFLGQNGAGPVGFIDALWLNDGNGVFSAATPPSAEIHTTFSCALRDIDGDGRLDLILGQEDGIRLLRLGPEGFAAAEYFAGGLTTSVLPIDFDGDGDLDLFGGTVAGIVDRILVNH